MSAPVISPESAADRLQRLEERHLTEVERLEFLELECAAACDAVDDGAVETHIRRGELCAELLADRLSGVQLDHASAVTAVLDTILNKRKRKPIDNKERNNQRRNIKTDIIAATLTGSIFGLSSLKWENIRDIVSRRVAVWNDERGQAELDLETLAKVKPVISEQLKRPTTSEQFRTALCNACGKLTTKQKESAIADKVKLDNERIAKAEAVLQLETTTDEVRELIYLQFPTLAPDYVDESAVGLAFGAVIAIRQREATFAEFLSRLLATLDRSERDNVRFALDLLDEAEQAKAGAKADQDEAKAKAE